MQGSPDKDHGSGMSDEAERKLNMELTAMDLSLKTTWAFRETPRNVAILVAAVTGAPGSKLGQARPGPQPIVIQLQQPAASGK